MALAASPVFVRDVEMAESELGQSYEALGERENALGAYHRAYELRESENLRSEIMHQIDALEEGGAQ